MITELKENNGLFTIHLTAEDRDETTFLHQIDNTHETVDVKLHRDHRCDFPTLTLQVAQLRPREDKKMTGQEFTEGWKHFCECINFSQSWLDATAIKFMSEMPYQAADALNKLEKTEDAKTNEG